MFRFGWCGTTSKIITGEKKGTDNSKFLKMFIWTTLHCVSYHLDNKQFTLDGRPSDYGAEDDIQISSYAGWGVCGKTCDESLETVIFGTVYNMHIFMQFYLGSTDWNS